MVLDTRLDTRDELGFERRWCWWRCWWRLTPSRWEDRWWWRWWRFSPSEGMFPCQNSSSGALDLFRQGSASWRRSLVPKACLWFFFGRKTSYSRRWALEGQQGAHEAGGAPPTLVARVWAPSGIFFAQYFLLFPKITSVEFQGFWSCAE